MISSNVNKIFTKQITLHVWDIKLFHVSEKKESTVPCIDMFISNIEQIKNHKNIIINTGLYIYNLYKNTTEIHCIILF